MADKIKNLNKTRSFNDSNKGSAAVHYVIHTPSVCVSGMRGPFIIIQQLTYRKLTGNKTVITVDKGS